MYALSFLLAQLGKQLGTHPDVRSIFIYVSFVVVACTMPPKQGQPGPNLLRNQAARRAAAQKRALDKALSPDATPASVRKKALKRQEQRDRAAAAKAGTKAAAKAGTSSKAALSPPPPKQPPLPPKSRPTQRPKQAPPDGGPRHGSKSHPKVGACDSKHMLVFDLVPQYWVWFFVFGLKECLFNLEFLQ